MCCLRSANLKAYMTSGNPPHSPPKYEATIYSLINAGTASRNIVLKLKSVLVIGKRAVNCSPK